MDESTDILLPRKIMLRKNILTNGRLSLGTEMDTTTFYLYPTGKKYEFRQLEINSGVVYEHNLGNNVIGTIKTGLRATPSSRILIKITVQTISFSRLMQNHHFISMLEFLIILLGNQGNLIKNIKILT